MGYGVRPQQILSHSLTYAFPREGRCLVFEIASSGVGSEKIVSTEVLLAYSKEI